MSAISDKLAEYYALFSHDESVQWALGEISKTDNVLKCCMENINWAEIKRISDVLKDFKNDEERLKKCIDNIEIFHRDMFVLPEEVKQAETENAPTTNDDVNETEYSVSEPDTLGIEPIHLKNEPDISMNGPDLSMHQPGSSTDGQNTAHRRLIIKIPKSLVNMLPNESSNSDTESDVDMDESSCETDQSRNVEDEPCDKEPKDEEYEIAKQVLVDFMADKERGVTELVLVLISKFSDFQQRLRAAEKCVSPTSIYFPSGSNRNFSKSLKKLSWSVLHMDKIVYTIYEKYNEMLEGLHNVFE